MIIYRPHKGSLAEALKFSKEFNSEKEMKEYIVNDWTKYYADLGYNESPFDIDDIIINDEIVDDERCGWHDTRHVCVKRLFEEDYMEMYNAPQCIGFCATDYEKLTPEEVNERIKNMR